MSQFNNTRQTIRNVLTILASEDIPNRDAFISAFKKNRVRVSDGKFSTDSFSRKHIDFVSKLGINQAEFNGILKQPIERVVWTLIDKVEEGKQKEKRKNETIENLVSGSSHSTREFTHAELIEKVSDTQDQFKKAILELETAVNDVLTFEDLGENIGNILEYTEQIQTKYEEDSKSQTTKLLRNVVDQLVQSVAKMTESEIRSDFVTYSEVLQKIEALQHNRTKTAFRRVGDLLKRKIGTDASSKRQFYTNFANSLNNEELLNRTIKSVPEIIRYVEKYKIDAIAMRERIRTEIVTEMERQKQMLYEQRELQKKMEFQERENNRQEREARKQGGQQKQDDNFTQFRQWERQKTEDKAETDSETSEATTHDDSQSTVSATFETKPDAVDAKIDGKMDTIDKERVKAFMTLYKDDGPMQNYKKLVAAGKITEDVPPPLDTIGLTDAQGLIMMTNGSDRDDEMTMDGQTDAMNYSEIGNDDVEVTMGATAFNDERMLQRFDLSSVKVAISDNQGDGSIGFDGVE